MMSREQLLRLPFWSMLWKEFVQMRRDRITLGMMVGIPAIQLMLFGYAIQTEVRHLPTIVLDESKSAESRALVAAIEHTGNFDVVEEVPDRVVLKQRFDAGSAKAAVVIPPRFAIDLKRGRAPEAQVIVDAADPLSSTAAINGAVQAGLNRSLELARARGAPQTRIDLRVRPWYNPGLRSSTYIVPGIIGVLLSMTLIIINSMAIVRERERGTLEQLVVTPISRTGLMLGKIVPFLLVGYVQITVILVLGRILFRIPILGSLPTLYLLAFPFIAASLAIGLFLSTLVQTQTQAMQLGFLFMLPNILLSGFMFPREAMPLAAQWISDALPLTYFLTVLRGILLKGVGFESLWKEGLVLAGFAMIFVILSVRRFRKTVD
jgi:drug efflux transport system permease protein